MAGGRQALYYLAASRYVSLAIQIATTIVIARLLTPSEIGIFSVGAAFVALGHLLRDFGSGSYIIQEKELTTDHVRSAFSVTLLLGWTIALAILLLAPIVADFYEKQGIRDVLNLLSINFFLLPFGSIPLAFAQRELNFIPSSIASIGSTITASAVSIFLAYQGQSYLSLVWGSIAGTIATVILVTVFRPKTLPFVLPGFKGIRRVVSFGSKMSSIMILGKLASLTPELVLGKAQDFHSVGLYSRTHGTATLFDQLVMMIINPVVTPLFAERLRSGGNIRSLYLHGLICVTGLAWAFSANLAVLAHPFVLALYGDQWEDIVTLVQIWSIALVFNYLTSLVDQVLIGTGNINRLLRYAVFISIFQITGFVITGLISLQAVLVVVAISPVLRLAWLWPDIKRVCQIDYRDIVGTIRISLPPAILSAAGGGTVVYGLESLSVNHPLALLLIGSAVSGSIWLIAIWRSQHPLWSEGLQAVQRLRR